jgi:hypothetical protein
VYGNRYANAQCFCVKKDWPIAACRGVQESGIPASGESIIFQWENGDTVRSGAESGEKLRSVGMRPEPQWSLDTGAVANAFR